MSRYDEADSTDRALDGPLTEVEREALYAEFPGLREAQEAFNALPAPF